MRHSFALLLLLTGVAVLTACSSESPEPPGTSRVEPRELICTPNPELIATQPACRVDTTCPCGSHCSLGVCKAECATDADCDWRCDSFGRCRAQGDDTLTPALDPSRKASLQLLPAHMFAAAGEPERTLHVRVGGAAAKVIRLVAEEGLQVRCAEDEAYAAECFLYEVPVGAEIAVGLRESEPLAGGASLGLRAFADHAVASASYEAPGNGAPQKEALMELAAGPVPSGVYEGSAQLLGAAVGSESAPADLGTSLAMTLPLTADVFGDDGVFALHDPTRMLHPGGTWVARLRQDGAGAELKFPAYPLHSGQAAAGIDVEVIGSAADAEVSVQEDPATLSFDLLVRYTGIFDHGRAPQVRFRVVLTRVGDVTGGAPAVPEDVVASLDPSRKTTTTPWEVALEGVLPPLGFVTPEEQARQFAFLEALYGGSGTLLDACLIGDATMDAMARFHRFRIIPEAASFSEVPLEETDHGVTMRFGIQYDSDPHDPTLPYRRAIAEAFAGTTIVTGPAGGGAVLEFQDLPAGEDRDLVGAIPCGFSHLPLPIEGAGSYHCTSGEIEQTFTSELAVPDVDFCDEAVALTGCEPFEFDSSRVRDLVRIWEEGYARSDSPCAGRSIFGGHYPMSFSGVIQGRVTKACLLPQPRFPSCGELLHCADPAGSTLQSSLLADVVRPSSGDLACGAGPRSGGLDFDLVTEKPIGDPGRLAASNLGASCAEELDRFRVATPGTPVPESIGSVFPTSTCVDGPRLITAVLAGTSLDRARFDDPAVPVDERGSAFAARLLQGWVQVHGHLAREAVEGSGVAATIRRNPPAGVTPPADPMSALDRSLNGWDLLLHPRFAEAVAGLPAAVLAAPDYRAHVGSGLDPNPTDEQRGGLAVAILETLRTQAELAEVVLDESPGNPGNQAAARAMRTVVLMRAVALDLHARAVAGARDAGLAAPTGGAAFEHADDALMARLNQLLRKFDDIRGGKNPLGIDENDLPLYFFSDTVGPGGRFGAISDFLLGTGPGSMAWAPALVGQASELLGEARASWVQQQDRQLKVVLSAREEEERVDAVRGDYGARLLSLCGGRPGVDAGSALGADLNPGNCYIRDEDPACSGDLSAWAQMVKVEDIELQLCKIDMARSLLGPTVGLAAPDLDSLSRAEGCELSWEPAGCSEVSSGPCLRCASAGQGDLVAAVGPASFHTAYLAGASDVMMQGVSRACEQAFPHARIELPAYESESDASGLSASCFRGSLGELALTVRATALDVEIARSELTEHSDAYEVAMKSCFLLRKGNADISKKTAELLHTLAPLREAKLAADIESNAAKAAKSCADAVGGVKNFLGVFKAIGTCTIEGGKAVKKSGSAAVNIEPKVNKAQLIHDAQVANIERQTEELRCFNDAKLELVGAQTSALRIDRAVMDLDAALSKFEEAKRDAAALMREGRASVAGMAARSVIPLAHDYWASEAIDAFARKMKLAKRATYLAVRAVEYEYQQSLPEQGRALAAQVPADLSSVLDGLWAAAGTRRIEGKAPTQLKVVVSLRDQLLQLGDQQGWDPSWLRLSPEEKFRIVLKSPRFATHDADGNYLGQRIPFTLAPPSAFGAGDGTVVVLPTGQDCAERLWSVNASIVGASDVMASGSTFSQMSLEKSNVFYSQWCSSASVGDAFQVASVRPSHNLFRDPELGADVGDQLGVVNEASLFSKARIQPTINVDRGAFERDEYENGSTSELAARGLYGDYALFLPAGSLQIPGTSSGLKLDLVDDILLRLDYVSVAR